MSDEYGADIITLTDDDGQEYELEHLATLEHEGITYMAFTQTNTPDDEAEVEMIILKTGEEDGEEILMTLDSDEELEKIYQLFMADLEMEDESEGPPSADDEN